MRRMDEIERRAGKDKGTASDQYGSRFTLLLDDLVFVYAIVQVRAILYSIGEKEDRLREIF